MKYQRLTPLLVASITASAGSVQASIEANDVRLADSVVLGKVVSAEPAGSTHAYPSDHPESRHDVKLGRVVLEVLDTYKGAALPRRIEVAMSERDLVKALARYADANVKTADLRSLSTSGTGVGMTAVWFLQPVNQSGKFYLRTTGSRSESLRNGQPDVSALVCDTAGFSYAVTGLENGLIPEPLSPIAATDSTVQPYLRLLDQLASNADAGPDSLRHLRSLFALSPVGEDIRFLRTRALGRLVPAQVQKAWVLSRLRPMAAKARTDLDRLNWAAMLSQWDDTPSQRQFVTLLDKIGPDGLMIGFPTVTDPKAFLILARSNDPEWSRAGFVALAKRPGIDAQVLPLAIARLGKSERSDAAIREWAEARLDPAKLGDSTSELRSALISAQKDAASNSNAKG